MWLCRVLFANLKIMKNLFVGIDISKDTLDFCIIRVGDRSIIERGSIENNDHCITRWLKEFDENQVALAMEHTGHYGAKLAELMSERQMVFYVINPLELKRSLGVQRGKTDTVDAYRIANYSINNYHSLVPYVLPAERLRKLKALMTARERYVKILVKIKNSLKANEILGKTIDLKDLVRMEKKQIKSVDATIGLLEKQMQEIVGSSKELEKNYKKVTAVIGVGPITALKCIIETDNFLKFDNARKFSCHCGLAPFPYQSGSSVRGKTKTHHLRVRTLKAILFKAAGSAVQHDPQLKLYHRRKLAEGKEKLTVINAVANKIVLRIFAVVNRDEPFVKLAA